MEIHKEIEKIRGEFATHSHEDAINFSKIMDRIDDSEEERRKRHEEIMSIIKPISETYQSATQMGKWVMGLAVFISIILGILLSIKSFFIK